MNIIRKFCADGRSSTLSLIECDVTGDARQLAELADDLELCPCHGR